MNCEICHHAFDHSIHKPYILCCPHTFCLSCINKLISNKCPTCNAEISAKHPNIALLKLVPETLYDKLKYESLMQLNKISELKDVLSGKRKVKLNQYLETLNSIEENFTSETNKFIELVRINDQNFLKEISMLGDLDKTKLLPPRFETELSAKLKSSKESVEKDLYDEKQLTTLSTELDAIKTQTIELTMKIEIKFDPFCCLSLRLPSKKERLVEVYFVPLDSPQPLVKYKVCVT